jgi:hypothetical protein
LKELVERRDAELVIFDDDLSPAQVKNLEKALERKVVDRSELILDIFARRARTREAVCRSSWRSSSTRCAAHRHVEALGAPGRRHRHARPGRDAARNRPTDRA